MVHARKIGYLNKGIKLTAVDILNSFLIMKKKASLINFVDF